MPTQEKLLEQAGRTEAVLNEILAAFGLDTVRTAADFDGDTYSKVFNALYENRPVYYPPVLHVNIDGSLFFPVAGPARIIPGTLSGK